MISSRAALCSGVTLGSLVTSRSGVLASAPGHSIVILWRRPTSRPCSALGPPEKNEVSAAKLRVFLSGGVCVEIAKTEHVAAASLDVGRGNFEIVFGSRRRGPSACQKQEASSGGTVNKRERVACSLPRMKLGPVPDVAGGLCRRLAHLQACLE